MNDEQEFLERARAGDADALGELLARHAGAVESAIASDIGPAWRSLLDAADVMQVTYLEAFLHVGQLAARDAAGFVAWLKRMAQNNLRDAIRELDRQKRPSPARRVQAGGGDDSYVALVELLGATSSTPSRHVASQEAAAVLDRLIDRLPPDYARVLLRIDLQGGSAGQVAQEMGRSVGAIHMLRARALDLLRSLLLEETDFLSRAT